MSRERAPAAGTRRPQKVYLEDIPRENAQARLEAALKAAELWRVLGVETIPLDEHAAGRITSAPIWARMSSPHYHASAMDGFAVSSKATQVASPSGPLTLGVAATVQSMGASKASYVDTGDALPDWADAVIPIENVEPLNSLDEPAMDARAPAKIRVRAAVAPWSHVRPMGEDIVATQLVIPAGHELRAVDLGAILAAGHTRVEVARRPRVAIIPTGSELVVPGSAPLPGAIVEYNSIVLAAQINELGGVAARHDIVKDDPKDLTKAIREVAGDHDLILLNAGSSAGAEDFSAAVIEELGEVLVHGVAVRPGHPVILGMLASDARRGGGGIPIIGVPGYPVSAALTVDIFVRPLIEVWLGKSQASPDLIRAELTRKITSPAGDEDHVRVVLGQVGERVLAAPLPTGAGIITSLVRADGILVIPPGVQGVEAGEVVQVHLQKRPQDLERTILCLGSHDVTLDLLAQYLAQRGRRMASTNLGSVGGLLALRRDVAHVAGSHLLDPTTGEYNVADIRRYLPEVPVTAVAVAFRQQGLIVPRGNPKNLRDLEDLARAGVTFVNRQRGSGTRVLLDHHLGKRGIDQGGVRGYEREEYTHLAVAAAVASGRADCGLGIAAAAEALGLDFVPLFSERFDLVMRKEYARSELLGPLRELLDAGQFREEVRRLPGYDTSVMGAVVLED